MRAIQAEHLSGLQDYHHVRLPDPVPGPNQVLIQVQACGVGYVDALVALGRYQVKPPLPHIPGNEVAGVVAAVGAEVSEFHIGERVIASVRGGFAQLACAPVETVERLPDAMSDEQAAGFRINYLTAYHGLRDRAGLATGESLLVFGAAGGVGLAAVQVGRRLGAHVIAVGSTEEKRAFALAAGAHESLDTSAEGWRDRLKALTHGRGVDVVFDPVCGPLFELAFRSLSWRGRHLVVGFAGGPIPALPVNLPLMKGAGLIGVDVRQYVLYEPHAARQALRALIGQVGTGDLTPPVGRVFDFDHGAEALDYALSGQGLGKTILRIT